MAQQRFFSSACNKSDGGINGKLELKTHSGVILHLLETNLEGLLLELKEAWVAFVSRKISGAQQAEVIEAGGPQTKALKKGIGQTVVGG